MKRDFAIVVALLFMSFLFLELANFSYIDKKIKGVEVTDYTKEIEVLQQEVKNLQDWNSQLSEEIISLKTSKVEKTVEEELQLSDEEKQLLARVISYYCKNEPNATKMYVGCTVLNRMYNSNMSLSDAVDNLGVAKNNLDAVNYETTDMTVVLKLLHKSYREVDEMSSGCVYFCENENYQKYVEKGMLLLFTSGKYTFFTDFAVG